MRGLSWKENKVSNGNESRVPLHVDVAIVGAGPVGLMIANTLGEQGLRVVVVERL